MTRWQRLCSVLTDLEQQEPGLEGLRWPLFLIGSSEPQAIRPATMMIRHGLRWIHSLRFGHSTDGHPVWYGMHGRSAAHELPYLAVHQELALRGIHGTLLGPYPFSAVHLAPGWRQAPLVHGATMISPWSFLRLRKVAEELAHGLVAALRGAPDLFERVPSSSQLLNLVWSTLAIDREVATLVQLGPPKVIVVGSDLGPLRNPLIRHGRNAGAYTLTLQHGLQGEFAGVMAAEKISLWGEYHRDISLGFGAPPEALMVDGSPRMDLVIAAVHNRKARETARSELGISADEPVLLHLLDNMGVIRRLYSSVVSQFKEHASEAFAALTKRMRVLVRPHPSDSDQDWEYLRAAGCIIVPAEQMPLSTAISVADIASTMMSTAGLEALWCGRPLVFFRPPGKLPLGDLITLGAGQAVCSAREWAETVLALALSPLERKKALESAAVFSAASLAYPGEGARRVAERIESHL